MIGIIGGGAAGLLVAYLIKRDNSRPGSNELRTAAIRRTEWFEHVRSNVQLDPVSFAYSSLLRAGHIQFLYVCKRNPDLAAAYERLHPAPTIRSTKQLTE